MTIWMPELAPGVAPGYRALAEATARDIAHGRLAHGARLPAQRAFAVLAAPSTRLLHARREVI